MEKRHAASFFLGSFALYPLFSKLSPLTLNARRSLMTER